MFKETIKKSMEKAMQIENFVGMSVLGHYPNKIHQECKISSLDSRINYEDKLDIDNYIVENPDNVFPIINFKHSNLPFFKSISQRLQFNLDIQKNPKIDVSEQ